MSRRRGFKRTSMVSAFGTQRRFGQATGRRAFQRGMRRLTTTGARGPTVVQPIVVPGFTRNTGFFGRFGAGGELKFHDQDIDDAAIAANGTIFTNASAEATLLRIPQGTSEIQRIGRKCTIRSIGWRFEIRLLATANVGASDVVRVILYLDKQCNGAAAAITDILESNNFQSFNNLGNKSRFRTLMDRTYALNTQAAAGDGTANDAASFLIQDTFFKKVNLPIEFSSTAGAIAEIRSNNINMLILSRAGLSDFESKMRLRFSDN